MKIISKSMFGDIKAILMWVSRDTLDRNELLTDDEYIEAVRKICDYLEIDYYTKGAEVPDGIAKQRYDVKTRQIVRL